MKALQLVCISTLLLKNSPSVVVQHSSRAFSLWDQSLSCPQPIWRWFNFKGNWESPQCQGPVGQKSQYLLHYSMAGSGFDYLRHNVRSLKDLPTVTDRMDVIVAGKRQEATEHVIFFGGDVQDYPENMQSHRDNGRYVRWNSLWTAATLCERFPGALVLVMKPHHMHLKTFSVYSQFVESNEFGCPTHSPDFGAWHTLFKVYEEAVLRSLAPLEPPPPTPNTAAPADENINSNHHQSIDDQSKATAAEDCAVQSDDKQGEVSGTTTKILKVPVHLIGFSKGCIVLNQLVHELDSVQRSSDSDGKNDDGNDRGVKSFLSQVRAMTWLDGGHSGGSNTWVTDQACVGHLAALGVDIQVHVTPYQVKDPMRRWIGKEQRKFVDLLHKAGAQVTYKVHFQDEPRSIENHFMVLETF